MFNNGIAMGLIGVLFVGCYLGAIYGGRKGGELVLAPMATFLAAFFLWAGLAIGGGSVVAAIIDFPLTGSPPRGEITELGVISLVMATIVTIGLVFAFYRHTRWMADVRPTAFNPTSLEYAPSVFTKKSKG